MSALPPILITAKTAVVVLANDLIRIDTNEHYSCDEAAQLAKNITTAIAQSRSMGTKAQPRAPVPPPLLLKR